MSEKLKVKTYCINRGQPTQIMKSNPEVFEQFCGEDETEQELIDAGYVIK